MPTIYQVAKKIYKEPDVEKLAKAGRPLILMYRQSAKVDPPRIEEKVGKQVFQVFDYPVAFEDIIYCFLVKKKEHLKRAIEAFEKYLETGIVERIELPQKPAKKNSSKPEVKPKSKRPKKKRKRIIRNEKIT